MTADLRAGYERALDLLRSGRLQDAHEVASSLVHAHPGDARALWVLGRVVWTSNGEPLAVLLLEQAVRLDPTRVALRLDVARVLVEAGQADAALVHARHALAADPGDAAAAVVAASAYAATRDVGRALALVDEALDGDGADATTLLAASTVLIELDRLPAARRALARAVALDPAARDGHVETIVRLRGRPATVARAARLLAGAIAIQPNHPELRALHRTEAAGGAAVEPIEGYAASLFDRYADTFDDHLTGDLRYRLPSAITSRAAQLAGDGFEAILDAGCGTGLCAEGLRPLTRRLVGIDASRRMLARASDKGVYDDLVVAELPGWLHGGEELFDLIVAAELLLYFGDLDALLEAFAGRLAPTGRLLASVLVAAAGEVQWRAVDSTFGHDPAYVTAVASRHGLDVLDQLDGSWRDDGDGPVPMTLLTLGAA